MRRQTHLLADPAPTRLPRTAVIAALSLAMITLFGCGDDGLGKRYPVRGTVSYKGQPLAKGAISFYATGSGNETRGAFGMIENGSYSLTTQSDGDGAFPGDYLVSINAKEADLAGTEKNAKGGSARQDDVLKAYKKAKSPIPQKYEVAETSGLKAKVESKSNSFDFELKD